MVHDQNIKDEDIEKKLLSITSKKTSLKEGIKEIQNIVEKVNISKETEKLSYYIYKKSLEENFIIGRSKKTVATSALYVACKLEKKPIFLKEIAEASGQTESKVFNTYRTLTKDLEIEIEPMEPEKFISKITSKLNLSKEVERKSEEIIKNIKKEGYTSGKSPQGIAAGAIYLASILCNEKRTQKEVANAAQVAQNTVRNHYKQISLIEK